MEYNELTRAIKNTKLDVFCNMDAESIEKLTNGFEAQWSECYICKGSTTKQQMDVLKKIVLAYTQCNTYGGMCYPEWYDEVYSKIESDTLRTEKAVPQAKTPQELVSEAQAAFENKHKELLASQKEVVKLQNQLIKDLQSENEKLRTKLEQAQGYASKDYAQQMKDEACYSLVQEFVDLAMKRKSQHERELLSHFLHKAIKRKRWYDEALENAVDGIEDTDSAAPTVVNNIRGNYIENQNNIHDGK